MDSDIPEWLRAVGGLLIQIFFVVWASMIAVFSDRKNFHQTLLIFALAYIILYVFFGLMYMDKSPQKIKSYDHIIALNRDL